MEREKVLSVGPLGPGAVIYLCRPGVTWARAPFLAPVCAGSGTFPCFPLHISP